MKRKLFSYLLWLFSTSFMSVFAGESALVLPQQTVSVILSSAASPAVRSAAEDLLAGLGNVFPDDAFILENNVKVKNPRSIEIVVDGKGSFESFRIVRINNGQGLRISGADPLGAVYGVYALLEHYGCGFYMTYDVFPAPEKGAWKLPDKDFADAPLMKERYSFNWHNFLSGCSGWGLPEWKSWIDQCRKMRYNVIMVHVYGNNPMFTFTFRGISKPVGYPASTDRGRDWGTPHVNDVRRMIGGEHFPAPVFTAPPALVPVEYQVGTVQSMMKEVFAYAKAQGMKIAFQIDVDTDPCNPPEMIAALPEESKIKAGKGFRPRPDMPDGKAYYTAILNRLFGLYPEIASVVVCTRIDPQPGYSEEAFPDGWKKEFDAIKNKDEVKDNQKRLAGYFWTGKVVKAFQEILHETGRGDVVVSQASWQLKAWLPYADVCSPKNVALLPLDYNEVDDQPEIDSPEELQWLRRMTDSGRRVVPVIWSHHDDGQYIGRTHTPFSNFATLLEQAGCDSYGVIHWILRPHGLYFKSHSVQVWQSTKDQPLEETCRTMARNIFGTENETAGGQYLLDWITNAPIYGRETTDFMIKRPFSVGRCDTFRYDSRRRMALLDKIHVSPAHPSAARHLAYWKGVEEFNVRFWSDETALQQSVNALKNGDIAAAKDYLTKTDPVSTIQTYADYASQLGIITGDQGILTLMNLKWYPSFIGQNQMLGNDGYRINFAPTVHEPLAQGEGRRSFHIDRNSKLWLVQGERELHGVEWILPENVTWKASNLSESDWEIVRTGLTWTESIRIPIVPAMLHCFVPQKFEIPFGGQHLKIRLYIADPTVKTTGDAVFDVMLYKGDEPLKLGTITIEPDVAEVFAFEISGDSRSHNLSLGIEPRKGKASLCGLTVETAGK